MKGLRSTNWESQNSHGMLRASVGNGEAKELICMTHGHEQRWGNHWTELGVLGGGGQSGKNWDNCNTIINKK